jgi:uncharacterized protein
MSAPLPEKLDPWRAVQFRATFAGEAVLDALPRLAAAASGAAGPARYTLRFEVDAQGRAVVLGRVSMALRLICQRCLGEVEVAVDAPIALGLVRAAGDPQRLGLAQVPGLPDHLDPLPLGDEPVCVMDWIEDELLLAIPQVPMHPPGHCEVGIAAAPDDGTMAQVRSPFAALAALRDKKPDP